MSERESLTDLTLERYQLGELSPEEMDAVSRRLERDRALRRRLREIEESDRQLRRQYPPALMAEQIEGRLGREAGAAPRRRSASTWRVPALVAAAAALVLVVLPRIPDPSRTVAPAAVDEGIRIKGLEPTLVLFRKTGDGSEALTDGDSVAEGDQLRVGYRAAGHSHGVIVSIDGRGTVTRHFPSRGSEAAPLEGSGTVLLDYAYVLDDAPRWERFYFVTGQESFDVELVVAAARRLAARPAAAASPLDLPPGLAQAVVTLRKEVSP